MKKLCIISVILFCTFYLFSQEYTITENKGKYGIIDSGGKIIVPVKYKVIYECEYAPFYFVLEEKKWKYFLYNANTNKRFEILDFEYFGDCNFNEETFLRIIKDGKAGLMQFPEKIIIDPAYDMLYKLDDYYNMILLNKATLYSFYNIKSKEQSDWFSVYNFYETFNYSDGWCMLNDEEFIFAEIEGQMHILNMKGDKYPIFKFDESGCEGEDITDCVPFLTKRDGKYGFMDEYGNLIIDCVYEDAGLWYDYFTYAKLNAKYGIIDETNYMIVPFVYDNITVNKKYDILMTIGGNTYKCHDPYDDSEVFPVPKKNKWGYKNKDDKTVIDFKFDAAREFSQGLAAVNTGGKYIEEEEMTKGGKWGYIALTGDIVIDCIYEGAKDFKEHLAPVKRDGKWGYIDYTGKFMIENIYDEALVFSEGKALVVSGNNRFYINTKGECIEDCP